jgi:hypothetical protein
VEDYTVKWFREFLEYRRQRKLFEALYALEMEQMDAELDYCCDWCEDNPEACICDEFTDCD